MMTEQLTPKFQKEFLPGKCIFSPQHSRISWSISAASGTYSSDPSSGTFQGEKSGFHVSNTVTCSSLYLNTWTAARITHPSSWHASIKPKMIIALRELRVEVPAALTSSFPEPTKTQGKNPTLNDQISTNLRPSSIGPSPRAHSNHFNWKLRGVHRSSWKHTNNKKQPFIVHLLKQQEAC